MTTKKPTRRQRHAYNRRLVDLICERIAVDGVALSLQPFLSDRMTSGAIRLWSLSPVRALLRVSIRRRA